MVQQRRTRGLKRKNDPILDVEDLKNTKTSNSAMSVLQESQATGEHQSASIPPDPEASNNQEQLPVTRRDQKKIRLVELGSTYIGPSTLQGKEGTRFEESPMRHATDLGQTAQEEAIGNLSCFSQVPNLSVLQFGRLISPLATEQLPSCADAVINNSLHITGATSVGKQTLSSMSTGINSKTSGLESVLGVARLDSGSEAKGKKVVLGDEIYHHGGNYGEQVSPVVLGAEFPNIPLRANGTTSKGKEIITHENMHINASPTPWASGLEVATLGIPGAVYEEIDPALQGGPSPTDFSRPTIWLSDKGLGWETPTSGNAGFSATDFGAGNAGFAGYPNLHLHYPEVVKASDHGSNGTWSLLNRTDLMNPNYGPATAQLGRPVQLDLSGSGAQYNTTMHQDQLNTGLQYLQQQPTRMNPLALAGWNHGPTTAQVGRPMHWGLPGYARYFDGLGDQEQQLTGLQYLQPQPARMNPLEDCNWGPAAAQLGQSMQWGLPGSWAQNNNSHMTDSQYLQPQPSRMNPPGGWNAGVQQSPQVASASPWGGVSSLGGAALVQHALARCESLQLDELANLCPYEEQESRFMPTPSLRRR